MNNTNIIFTLFFFFSFGIVSQAQVENHVSNNMDKFVPLQTSVQGDDESATESNTTTKTESNTTTKTESNTTSADQVPATYVFYFNHKQFMRPILRKSALC